MHGTQSAVARASRLLTCKYIHHGKGTIRWANCVWLDWDEIGAWSSRVYMPYAVSPTGKALRPRSTMHSAMVGRITVTRFAYGIPVHIQDWSQEAGNAVVLTTIGGLARHRLDDGGAVETGQGESFVVDCSRTDYLVDFDPDHLQLNLTIPHAVLEQTCVTVCSHRDVVSQRAGESRAETTKPRAAQHISRRVGTFPVRHPYICGLPLISCPVFPVMNRNARMQIFFCSSSPLSPVLLLPPFLR